MKLPVDGMLRLLRGSFDTRYASAGRPSVPPEWALRALPPQVFHSLRRERQLMKQLEYDLLFRQVDGVGVDDPVWDRAVFCISRGPAVYHTDITAAVSHSETTILCFDTKR